MSGNSEAIVKTFRQILDIYKQINMLMKQSERLMKARGWEPSKPLEGKMEHYDAEALRDSLPTIVKIHFYLQRPFASTSERAQIKYITVMIDDEEGPSKAEDFEPVVVGTTLTFVNREELTDSDRMNWDGYWWYHWKWKQAKESNSKRHGPWTLENHEVREIQKQDWIMERDEVRSNLQSVRTFGIPLVEVTNKETLEKEIIKPLLDV